MSQPARPLPLLAYDTSAYELSPDLNAAAVPWSPADVAEAIRARADAELARRELLIDYYRIGTPLAYPLPVSRRFRIEELPVGISSITYPWLIWQVWALEERWRILHAAWRMQANPAAGACLQAELAALRAWDCFKETSNEVGLVTGHIAGVLALALDATAGWGAAALADAQAAADALLDRDVAPWFTRQWPPGEPLTPLRLHNIPVIALVRAAQLARVRRHPFTPALEAQAIEALESWVRYRTEQNHTEGTSYDGYLMDSLTGWLATLPQRDALFGPARAALRSLADQWMALALPGRLDLHAPLGDTEPQMPFWLNALQRLARWYDWPDVAWFVSRVPLVRLPAALLAEYAATPAPAGLPPTGSSVVANAVTYRSGWQRRDHTVTVSLPRVPLHHLHPDAGHVIVGWHGRFWITDPGYQQYRPGEERDYTIGSAAHNAPVIGGRAQSDFAAELVRWEHTDAGLQAVIELSRCYRDLPAGASVRRTVQIAAGEDPHVTVADEFTGFQAGEIISYHWLGGAQLAWSGVDGWARLSDGTHALWLGLEGETLSASRLVRHPGSRGALTLTHATTLPTGRGVRRWVIRAGAAGRWQPPAS
ncbi:MAG: heparinase II/III family protein [Opitutaceae bacterium]|nr:heparinase II/III family protein [Opitutaceae bacterium]